MAAVQNNRLIKASWSESLFITWDPLEGPDFKDQQAAPLRSLWLNAGNTFCLCLCPGASLKYRPTSRLAADEQDLKTIRSLWSAVCRPFGIITSLPHVWNTTRDDICVSGMFFSHSMSLFATFPFFNLSTLTCDFRGRSLTGADADACLNVRGGVSWEGPPQKDQFVTVTGCD